LKGTVHQEENLSSFTHTHTHTHPKPLWLRSAMKFTESLPIHQSLLIHWSWIKSSHAKFEDNTETQESIMLNFTNVKLGSASRMHNMW